MAARKCKTKRCRRGLGGQICKTKVVAVRKVRLDRGGYANKGRDYYGRGEPVYMGEVQVQSRRWSDGAPDGCRFEILEVRAADRSSAKTKILAEAKRRWR